jgi:ABC-type transporter MlaC component
VIRALLLALSIATHPAERAVDELHTRIVTLAAKGWPPDRKAVESVVAQSFDLELIAREMLGSTKSTPAQRSRLASALGARLSREIVRAGPYSQNDGFRILARRELSRSESLVTTRATPPGEDQPVTLGWRLRAAGGRWVVVDTLRDGVSSVGTQRDDLRTALRRQPLDAVIEAMERRGNR